VFDCNVIVSALVSPNGPCAELVDLVHSGTLQLMLSEEIVAEYRRVVAYPRVVQRLAGDVQESQLLVQKIYDFGHLTEPSTTIQVVDADPTDNKFIACAVSGNAPFIISGEKHLLELGSYQGIQVLRPKEMLFLLGSGSPS